MSDVLKISGPIKVGSFSSDPSGAENGYIYYNTTDSKFKMYQGGAFKEIVDEDVIANLVATDVAYERADGSKKNIQASSDDVESALTDLDDSIGSLAPSPSNYSPGDASIVADHLSAIDSALGSVSSDASGTTYSPSTLTDWNGDSDPGNVDSALDQLAERVDDNEAAIALNTAKVSADGSVTSHNDVTDAGSGAIITTSERNKLSGIEALADVTDATNVEAAGAVMESDTTTASMSFVVDEDDMVSDSDTKVPTQQSVKAYVDAAITLEKSYQGGYDANTNTPDLDSSPIAGIKKGDVYDVTAAGTFFTEDVEIGDSLRAKQDNPTTLAHWVIVQSNLTPASIKTQYESNADTNVFTDAEKTKLSNQSGINTGDEVAATDSTAGIVELATEAEVNTGTDDTRAVTPASLATVKSDINSKIGSVAEDTSPALGGNLDVNGQDIEDADADILLAGQNSLKRAKQASKANFIEEEYIHSISLSASQTDTVISSLTFAHATIEGLEIVYKVKEATSGDIKIGTIRVVTNGTNVVLNEIGTETASTGITFSAAINGSNVEIRYSSGSNGATMRADVKKFLA